MKTLGREARFILALWQANIQVALEYRAAFISQMLGMMANDAIYFTFWVLFFNRFHSVGGWRLHEMLLLFGVVSTALGLAIYFCGNALLLGQIISNGQLDYYLALPKGVLPHVLASRSITSGAGDIAFGLVTFCLAGRLDAATIGRFCVGVLIAFVVFVSFLTAVHSLAFWTGGGVALGSQATMAAFTFSLYPVSVFQGLGKLIVFTVVPAAFIGALPTQYVAGAGWTLLAEIAGAALFFAALAIAVFSRGLRRYESGSVFQVRL